MKLFDRVGPRLGLALGAGGLIAAVDNVWFQGEVSPIVVVGLLLAAAAAAGALWGTAGWIPATIVWACIPGAHLVKRLLGLPDTLHPNTYRSILLLAGFTLGVTAVGFAAGLLAGRTSAAGMGRSDGH